jgi:NADH dehydrogenase
VVNLVAILQGDEAAFERTHVQLPRTLASACRQAGVRRVIHVSALGVGPAAPSRYLRSKTRGEAVLQEAAELDLTLLRPSVIFGADDQFLNLFAALQAWFPLMPLAGAEAQFQPVWVEDVAAAIVRCAQDGDTIGKIYELTGPQVLRLGELVQMAGRLSGHARRVLPLPSLLAKAQALLMESLPGEPMMSRDNLASMEVPNIASGTLPGLAELGIQAHAVEPIAAGYLRHGVSKMDVLRRGAHR